MHVHNQNHKQTFLLVDLPQYKVFLGLPWLHSQNPHIDWKQHTVTYDIRKVSPATEMAINNKTKDTKEAILTYLKKYATVFSEKAL